MTLIVNKFGGGIINNASSIKHLPEVFKKQGSENSINVFSAFGKTTNNLEKVVKTHLAKDKEEHAKTLTELKAFHVDIASELFPREHVIFDKIEDIFEKINDTISDATDKLDPKFIYDQIVPYGEVLASLIVSSYLSHLNVSNNLVYATDFLKTDSNFNSANVDKKTTSENLKKQITKEVLGSHKNIITQGFIGFSDRGMTTLGREGSDYTAGILGNLMNASKVILWKDVPGVMDKNPNLPGNENAKKIDVISYNDFIKSLETTASGLVHPKTLNEVKEKGIPLQVRPFWDLNSEGTIICDNFVASTEFIESPEFVEKK